MAAYTSRPRTTEAAGAARLVLCEQADADCNRLCTARHSDLTSCDSAAGFDDRELFELLLGPGHRSPLYRSSHLAARFALGLATGQEWSHFYYLSAGADGKYAIGDVVEATATFRETVNVTGVNGGGKVDHRGGSIVGLRLS